MEKNWYEDPLFIKAFDALMIHEGRYVDHPSDPGGATNFGISLRFYRDKIDGAANDNVIKSLRRDDAARIYYLFFWVPYRYWEFTSPVAIKLFDMAVNMGPKQAHKLLQRAINGVLGLPALKVDGAAGPQTRKLARTIDPQKLLIGLRYQQAVYYRALVRKRPQLAVFLKGWLNRAQA